MGTFIAMEENFWPYSCWPNTVLGPACLNERTFFENQGGVGSLLWQVSILALPGFWGWHFRWFRGMSLLVSCCFNDLWRD